MVIAHPALLVFLQVCSIAAPAVLISVFLLLLRECTVVLISNWLTALVAFLAIPVYHIGRAKVQYWLNERKAAKLGAALPPRWDGKLIGNWDNLMSANKALVEGFLSKLSRIPDFSPNALNNVV